MKLHKKTIEAIKHLHKTYDPLFGGSFGLWLHGLIDRKPADLDVIVKEKPDGAEDLGSKTTPETLSLTTSYFPNDPDFSSGYWAKIDYIVPKTEQEYSYALFEGIEIKVAHPRYAIAAKEYYIKDGYHHKHSEDLKIIRDRYKMWEFNYLVDNYYEGR